MVFKKQLWLRTDLALEQQIEAPRDLELVVVQHRQVQPPPRPAFAFRLEGLGCRVEGVGFAV